MTLVIQEMIQEWTDDELMVFVFCTYRMKAKAVISRVLEHGAYKAAFVLKNGLQLNLWVKGNRMRAIRNVTGDPYTWVMIEPDLTHVMELVEQAME